MELKTCRNGHIYDLDISPTCPICDTLPVGKSFGAGYPHQAGELLLATCQNGHTYDPNISRTCPICDTLPVGDPCDSGYRQRSWGMKLETCKNGHIYDLSISKACPICGALPLGEPSDINSWQGRSVILDSCSKPEYFAYGSNASVFRTARGQQQCALKVIECGQDLEKILKAEQEICLMNRLAGNDRVVRLIDSEVLYRDHYVVAFLLEEYVTPFQDYFTSHEMTAADILQLGIDICEALESCWNAGVAHLDIQPKNLFVRNDGRFLLGDFGCGLPTGHLAKQDTLRGSLSYMAPEVYEARKYSQSSELYSLGMVLYSLLNRGNLPFMESSPKDIAVWIRLGRKLPVPPLENRDRAVNQLLQKALAADVRNRYQTFREMCNDLMAVRDHILPSRNSEWNSGPQKAASKQSPLAAFLNRKKKKDRPEPETVPVGSAPSGYSEPRTSLLPPSGAPDTGTLFDSDYFATSLAEPFGSTMPLGPVPSLDSTPHTVLPAWAPPENSAPFDSVGHTIPVEPSWISNDFPAPMPPSPAPVPPSPAPTGNPWAPTENLRGPAENPWAPAGNPQAPSANVWNPPEPSFGWGAPPTAPQAPFPGAGSYPGYPQPMPSYPPSYTPAPRMSQVQFSAIAPREARKEDYSIIQLFMYEQAFRAVVEEAIAMADGPVQEKRSGFQRVQDNTRVKIVLTCPDMPIEDNIQEQVWVGGYLQFDFAICPPANLRKRQILLTAAVYFNDVPATRLMLTVKALASYEEEIELARKDIVTAFVSYASQDRTRVGALIQGMRKARPDMDIFFDVATLRSGENWENTLYQEILRRDILFLCWSRNALASDWVNREWRFALENKGLDCIEPIPLEQPDICPPPKELWSKHFNDSLLYVINR